MKAKLTVVKIGSNIIQNEDQLNSFIIDYSQLKGAKILIHGGGKMATEISDKLGFKTIMNKGRRITSKENLEVITMVYAGLFNKTIVAKLQALNCNAMGLSGADANSIEAIKRPIKLIDFGWVGDVEKVNNKLIEMLLSYEITPVFCAVSHNGLGQLLNTNADTIAAEIAISMSNNYETELIYCFENDGVLMDVNDDKSVIKSMNSNYYTDLKKQNLIHGGMIPKLDNAFYALQNNVSRVIIRNASLTDITNSNYTLITL